MTGGWWLVKVVAFIAVTALVNLAEHTLKRRRARRTMARLQVLQATRSFQRPGFVECLVCHAEGKCALSSPPHDCHRKDGCPYLPLPRIH